MYNPEKRKSRYAIWKDRLDRKKEETIAKDLYSKICFAAGNGGNFSRVSIEGDTEFFLEDTTIIGYFSKRQIKHCIGEITNLEPDFGRAYCILAKRGSKTTKRNARYIFNFRSSDRFINNSDNWNRFFSELSICIIHENGATINRIIHKEMLY